MGRDISIFNYRRIQRKIAARVDVGINVVGDVLIDRIVRLHINDIVQNLDRRQGRGNAVVGLLLRGL